MENWILICIPAVVILPAVRSAWKHFRGEGGCCGGGTGYVPKKKKLRRVIATKTFQVDGMHCEKCSYRVTEVINDIPHVAGTVHLKEGTVTVSYEQEVPDAQIKARLERVGYTVAEVR